MQSYEYPQFGQKMYIIKANLNMNGKKRIYFLKNQTEVLEMEIIKTHVR